MNEFATLVTVKQLLDKLQPSEVERIIAYLKTYIDQRLNDEANL